MSRAESKFKVALIQLHPVPMAGLENLRKADDCIRRAAAEGARLAVLPEYFLNGWCPERKGWADREAAKGVVAWAQDLAKELRINIVPGTVIEAYTTCDTSDITGNHDDGDDGGNRVGEEEEEVAAEVGEGGEEKKEGKGARRVVLQNVCYFISSSGEILERYVKRNLWHPERAHLESGAALKGEQRRVFDTELGKVGLLVCWDLAFPEAFRALIKQGAETIIVPAFWTLRDLSPLGLSINPLSEAVFLDSTVVARAFENTACIVFVNAGGPDKDHWAGRSTVAMPIQGKVGACEDGAEGMKVVEVDMAVREEAERWYKIREDLKNGVIGGPC